MSPTSLQVPGMLCALLRVFIGVMSRAGREHSVTARTRRSALLVPTCSFRLGIRNQLEKHETATVRTSCQCLAFRSFTLHHCCTACVPQRVIAQGSTRSDSSRVCQTNCRFGHIPLGHSNDPRVGTQYRFPRWGYPPSHFLMDVWKLAGRSCQTSSNRQLTAVRPVLCTGKRAACYRLCLGPMASPPARLSEAASHKAAKHLNLASPHSHSTRVPTLDLFIRFPSTCVS